jgi:hypothetical protein
MGLSKSRVGLIANVRREKSGHPMNQWGIPIWLEKEVRARDKTCVYCRVEMIEKMPPGGSRRTVATWEHIINDANIATRANIARCCSACNSSKGTKNLLDWMRSDYCRAQGIEEETVADVVKEALARTRKADA